MTWKRVDANQGEVVAALRSVGADWIPTSGDPNIGFDGIMLFRGKAYITEIKDGAKPPSARKLTEAEAKRKLQCELHGVPYLIILSAEHALKTIGAMKNSKEVAGNCVSMGAKSDAQIRRDAARALRSVAANLEKDVA